MVRSGSPNWPELEVQRWGPSIGDPGPGLVIDHPAPARREAARADRDDESASAERAAIQDEPRSGPIALVRAVVADWPIPWREHWGRRANELAEAGVPHPDDERHAYAEVLVEKEGGVESPPTDVLSPAEPTEEVTPGATAPVRWQCTNRFCRDGSRWWMSRWGVVNCLNCVPPAFAGLVVAQGNLADAPLCDPSCSNQCAGSLPLTCTMTPQE